MHIYPGQKGYFCFVCNQGGDVIDFVQKLFNLSFPDAIAKLNDDFRLGLPIGRELSDAERLEEERIASQKRKEAEQQKERSARLLSAYHRALDRFIEIDKTIVKTSPQTPFDAISDEYAAACRMRSEAEYRLDLATMKMMEDKSQ